MKDINTDKPTSYIPIGWSIDDWLLIYQELTELSVSELAQITAEVGIVFTAEANPTKDEYLNVLDEADPEQLIDALSRIRRKNVKSPSV